MLVGVERKAGEVVVGVKKEEWERSGRGQAFYVLELTGREEVEKEQV